jgi:hypothetical protein
LAGIRLEKAQNVLERNTLADTAAPQHRHHLTAANVEAYVLKHWFAVKGFRHVPEFDEGGVQRRGL